MREIKCKWFPLAVACLLAIGVVPWTAPCAAQSQVQQWRIQDYEEYDDSEDYEEPEDYGEPEDYDASDGVEDFEESEDPIEYDSAEESASYDQSDDPNDYDGSDDLSDYAAADEVESDEDSIDSDEYGDESADADFDDEYFLDELEDDSWAPEIEFDEADDVLQTESGNWGVNEVYEVVESIDDMSWADEASVETSVGGPGSGGMPVVQRVVEEPGFARPAGQAKSPGAKPPTAQKPPSAGAAKPRLKSSFGGRPVANSGVPWQAQIYAPFPAKTWPAEKRAGKALWQLQHYCGGILIAENWVLTAAHCIDQEMVDSGYRVRLGSRDISRDDGWTYKIDRIVRHSRYADKSLPNDPNRYANDIALIRIVEDARSKPREPSRIQVIPLFRGNTLPAGTEVTGTGWGLTKAVEPALPNAVLLKVDLRVMDGAKCRSLRGYGPQKIGNGVFCAANPARSTCRGDSGGPVILTNGKPAVVGIVSWGKKRCSGDGHPGVYTRISSYLPWIDQAMKLPPGKNALP